MITERRLYITVAVVIGQMVQREIVETSTPKGSFTQLYWPQDSGANVRRIKICGVTTTQRAAMASNTAESIYPGHTPLGLPGAM